MTGRDAVPADAGLPQLQNLLDSDRMSGILGRLFDPDAVVSAFRIGFVRYRPGKSLVVGYEVTIGETTHDAFAFARPGADLAAQAAAPESSSLVAKLEGRTPARTPLAHDRELDALIQWLPLDLALPTMAEPPERLREQLLAAGLVIDGDDLPRSVKHKPMTRGVLRVDEHFAKTYPDRESFAQSVRALDASASLPFPTARCTAVVPELLLAAQSRLPGTRPPDPAAIAPRAGALLAALHRARRGDLPTELPRDRLERTVKQGRVLATIVPALADRLRRLVQRLEEDLPAADGLVTSHGGFHASQLLQLDGEIGVVDFDGMRLAPAALDLGSYVASSVERPDDVPRAGETLTALLAAYGSRPAGVTWYLAASLVGRARRPFARFQPGWPEAIGERVAAAEKALEL
jgi:hypothetical protein